jgi:transcriptional regulator with XRE-family HTH domain
METKFGNKVDRCLLCYMTGSELKSFRLKAGLTQEELAVKIGTHKTVVSRWERGKSNISASYQKLIAMIFKVSV